MVRSFVLCGVLCGVFAVAVGGCAEESHVAPDGTVTDTAAPDGDVSVSGSDAGAELGVDVSTADIEVSPDVAQDSGPGDVASPEDYCESMADAFCGFYLRCGRMAVADEASCRVAFLQGCNGIYEPLYASLVEGGHLSLSAAGMATCAAHLAAVDCDQQIFDLDGGCASMWLGLAPAGAACGPGLQSYVCDGSSTCVLDLSFCGTCVPLAGPDEPCDTDHRCAPGHHCEAGACVPRIPPGAPCDPDIPCVLGTDCVDGVCRGDTYVGLGEACGGTLSCPYASECFAGTCVAASLDGATCDGSTPCNSGWCDAGTCAPKRVPGQSCTQNTQCTSNACQMGTCAPISFSCLE